MKQGIFQSTILFFLLALLISCKNEPEGLGIIDPELEIYIDRFYEEAESRGVVLPSKEELTALFVDDIEDFCGYGYWDYQGTGTRRVEIENSAACWQDKTDLEKENFVFHELGHALLSRPHTSKSFHNSYPSSIMCTRQDGNIHCNNYQVYYQTGEMKAYYLDELFDEQSPEPAWVHNDSFQRVLYSDSIDNTLDEWEELLAFTEDKGLYDFYIDSSDVFGGSRSLAITKLISTPDDPEDHSYGLWLDRFDITDFEECSSVKARARMSVSNTFNGFVEIGLSLREYDELGELHRFMIHEIREVSAEELNSTGGLEIEIFCIPQRSAVVTVSFSFKSAEPATLYIDDVEVDLWK